jgi:hypothetical protein
VGYRPGGLHLGKFPTRYNSPLWRQDEPIVVLWDEPNVRRSWLKAELGQGRLKLTLCINDSCTIHSTFDLIIYHSTVYLLAKLFELYLEFLKNIMLLFVVLSLLSCRTHPFFPQIFSNNTVRRSHFFVMA